MSVANVDDDFIFMSLNYTHSTKSTISRYLSKFQLVRKLGLRFSHYLGINHFILLAYSLTFKKKKEKEKKASLKVRNRDNKSRTEIKSDWDYTNVPISNQRDQNRWADKDVDKK